jgi:hypothetical protein
MADTMVDVKALIKNPITGQMEERVIAKQLQCPPDTPKYNQSWVSEREKYIFERGWEKQPSSTGGLATYKDPKGSRLNGEVKHIRDLPNKGDDLNPKKPVHQLILPPAFHSFTLEEAVEMQARRDQAGEGGLTPLERLEAVEIECNKAYDEVRRIKASVKGILINQSLTQQGIRMGLMAMFDWSGNQPDDWKI